MKRLVSAVLAAFALSVAAAAITPDEQLDDPALEARARAISKELRCIICQSQSIDESNVSLARDLRVLVRERLVAGDTDQEVLDYIHQRYGDYVLLKPPVKGRTILLWVGPILFLVLGGALAAFVVRQASRTPVEDDLDAPDSLPESRA
jgi:cytochrome c-type biogenesis protein CcmH